ncbi:MAG: isoprenoid biosynthesis glyoxalase ElbB [Deltaproteobacteria bacterium]|nr:isoprenoid biosynthesis glyoxalase ElbB [Deltaproteobacteria bacterium]
MKNIAVVLSGCGVYDGSEIHESVITLLEIRKNGAAYSCFAPDKNQLHVINHTTGEEMEGPRNVLVESARIARGEIRALSELNPEDFDAVIFPGGFGAAKNLSTWAVNGPEGGIDGDVKRIINKAVNGGVPVALVCMAPVLVAKALEGTGTVAKITVGTTEDKSPYDIEGINSGMMSVGADPHQCPVSEFIVDEGNKIITTPAYMMEANIVEVAEGIGKTVKKLLELV